MRLRRHRQHGLVASVLSPCLVVLLVASTDHMITKDARAHDVEECKSYTVFGIRCGRILGELFCWPYVTRVRRCWLVEHTHEETEEDRDARVLTEMHDCIAGLVNDAFDGCDTPEDEEDREPCEELEMPTSYQYRNALRRRGIMTAEDPIITSSGSTCSSCAGVYHPSIGIKVNVALHDRQYGAERDGELADTIIHEKIHRTGVNDHSVVDDRIDDIIEELFEDKSFVSGACNVNWELQTQ